MVGWRVRSSRSVSRNRPPGIDTSSSTRSVALVSSPASSAAAPSASPEMTIPASSSTMRRSPCRTSGWSSAKIRIFIADDHPIVRQGLRRIVEADAGMVISGEADGAAALLAGLETSATDLVLLDVSMPGGLFLDTLRELRTRHPTIRVLALSVHPEDEWAVRALRAGASGYLTKDHSPDQLLDAIRRVYRGGKYVSPTLAEQLAKHLDAGGQRPPHELLSDREFEVMRRLGSGLTVSQIASELALSAKTVSTYRTRILEKMAVTTNADLVRYAARYGLIA